MIQLKIGIKLLELLWNITNAFVHFFIRHEFLSQYFDGSSGAIFKKAKRSLTNSFDQLLKRKTKEESEMPPTGFHQTSLPPRVGQVSVGKLFIRTQLAYKFLFCIILFTGK